MFIGLFAAGLLGAFEVFLPSRQLGRRLRGASFPVHFTIRALVYLVVIVIALELSSVLFTGRMFQLRNELLGHVADPDGRLGRETIRAVERK